MTSENISRYILPQRWIRYDMASIMDLLVEAKTAAGVLREMPYLPQWVEQIHEEQLRLEAAGTSRIEGAEFSQREQDEALAPDAATRTDFTRSQRQLRAADATYRWLRSQPADRTITPEFIFEVHRRIVTGCDDDHCEPGALRPEGWNVTFGTPRCRGVAGGDDCHAAFSALCNAITEEWPLTTTSGRCILLVMVTDALPAPWKRLCCDVPESTNWSWSVCPTTIMNIRIRIWRLCQHLALASMTSHRSCNARCPQ